MTEDAKDEIVIHVFVVGFHHKKGCVVEFAYPPLSNGENSSSVELPEEWKHLPTLALPDGSHNYEQDTIFFHLPSLDDHSQTVYGISCYRQMNAERLLRRSSDITRETVQKSVCVLSKLPLFGLIQVKLELITHAYFDERDFSKVSLLEETYRNLNSSLPKDIFDGQHAFLGLSVRDFVLRFKNGALLLFKLLLLERKVLFYKAPVKDLCSAVLTMCSLIPGMIETGLNESVTSLKNIHEPNYDDNSDDFVNLGTKEQCDSETPSTLLSNNNNSLTNPKDSLTDPDSLQTRSKDVSGDCRTSKDVQDQTSAVYIEQCPVNDEQLLQEIDKALGHNDEPKSETSCSDNFSMEVRSSPQSGSQGSLNEKATTEQFRNDMQVVLDMELSECGFPLAVFAKGMMCFPYLSLPFLDLLGDLSVRGFVVGATNILFKQKKHLFDVVVEVDDGKIHVLDAELRRQLHLTTEDLRFTDFLVRNVMEDRKDVFLDGTGWEGGDEWLRAQFKLYLLSLLRASVSEGKDIDAFNSTFVSSWKLTHNYRMWARRNYPKVNELCSVHPFHGQLSMADMKLKISHSMHSTEKGRRLNSAVINTGKAVMQTGKVVGGAISNAKSAVSSWWSNLSVPSAEKSDEKLSESAEKNGLSSGDSESQNESMNLANSEA